MILSWNCVYTPLGIRVNKGTKFHGYYEFLDEPTCDKCSSPGVNTGDCILHDWVYGFNKVYSMGKYVSLSRDEKHLLSKHIRFVKYHGYKQYSIPLGLALSIFVSEKHPELLDAEFIIPVPSHENKVARRGFNQNELILNKYCEVMEQPSLLCLKQLKDIAFAGKKTRLEERYKLVEDMFEFIQHFQDRISGKYLLIFDDVVTSCSQASKCSQILLDQGAKKVDVISLGRNELDDTS